VTKFQVFFALRTYAIWKLKRAIFILVITAYLPALVFNLLATIELNLPAEIGIKISEMVPICYILFDGLVLSLSLVPLWSARAHLGNSGTERITTVLFKHGIIYFILLLVVNVSQTIMTIITNEPFNATVILGLSSIMVSRFLLQLREVNSNNSFSSDDLPIFEVSAAQSRRRSSLRSAIVGNLGETLEVGFRDREDDIMYGEL